MGNGPQCPVIRGSVRRRVRKMRKEDDSGESDEDYVLNEDEESNESEGSLVAEEEEDFVDVEEEEKKKKRKKKRIVRRSQDLQPELGVLNEGRVRQRVKRDRVSDDEDEDEDEDYDFDEDENYDFDEDEDYDFDEEEDDDEEFAPDEIDTLDEEEKLEVKKKSNKVRKPMSQKKGSVKSRKRKRKAKVSKKPLRKKPRRLVASNTVSTIVSSDDDFDVSYRAAPKKIQKNSSRRKKRLVADWDSEAPSSEASDHEYTISDEEKLSLKEANRFCGNVTTRNSTLSKTLEIEGVSNYQQPKPLTRKGKEKVKAIPTFPNDLGKQECGICFSEEGKNIIRGTLNCCSHFFCFACIMEWSKVESRCPLCKQRFETISKPARSNLGFELRNTVIQVPMRDQVYQPSEEEVRGYLNPYESVICMECQQGGDDSLMLLCDLCDSAAHTFCVGLGQVVPEGNWYCRGCWTSNPGSCNPQFPPIGSTVFPTPTVNPEVSDPTPSLTVSVPDSPFVNGFGISPSPRYPVTEDCHILSPSGVGASTLSGRRRIHSRIRNMLSNNRMSQMVESATRNNGCSHDNVKSEVVDDEVDQGEELTVRLGSQSTSVEPLTREFLPCHSVQERYTDSASLSSLGGSNTVISNNSAGGTTSAELNRTNSVLGSEPLQRCRRRAYILTEDNISDTDEGNNDFFVEDTRAQEDIMMTTNVCPGLH